MNINCDIDTDKQPIGFDELPLGVQSKSISKYWGRDVGSWGLVEYNLSLN